MVDLYSIFCKIGPAESNEKYFPAEEITSTLPHRLGCSQERFPIFFVECCDEMPTTNINLKKGLLYSLTTVPLPCLMSKNVDSAGSFC